MLGEVRHGWLRVPYDGPEIGIIEIKVGHEWRDAYLDYDEAGNRVAQVPHAGRPIEVEVRCRVPQAPQGNGAEAGPTRPGGTA